MSNSLKTTSTTLEKYINYNGDYLQFITELCLHEANDLSYQVMHYDKLVRIDKEFKERVESLKERNKELYDEYMKIFNTNMKRLELAPHIELISKAKSVLAQVVYAIDHGVEINDKVKKFDIFDYYEILKENDVCIIDKSLIDELLPQDLALSLKENLRERSIPTNQNYSIYGRSETKFSTKGLNKYIVNDQILEKEDINKIEEYIKEKLPKKQIITLRVFKAAALRYIDGYMDLDKNNERR